MTLPQPHPDKVQVKDPKTQGPVQEDIPLMLPHVLFANLSHEYPEAFEAMFATSECHSFWKGVERTKDPRLMKPIASNGKVQGPATLVPLFIHGDGCEFQTRDSLMTWSWGSLLSQNPSLSAHLLLAAVPKSCSLPETWGPLDAWIAWSFTALTKGFHPRLDPWGNPLPKGVMTQLARQHLTKGKFKACIWAIQGDAEFCANVLKLPHWSKRYPCHECDGRRPVWRKAVFPEGKSIKIL